MEDQWWGSEGVYPDPVPPSSGWQLETQSPLLSPRYGYPHLSRSGCLGCLLHPGCRRKLVVPQWMAGTNRRQR